MIVWRCVMQDVEAHSICRASDTIQHKCITFMDKRPQHLKLMARSGSQKSHSRLADLVPGKCLQGPQLYEPSQT